MKDVQNLIDIALNLNASLSSTDRYQSLLRIIRQTVPYDASVLMVKEKDILVPLASYGLTSEAQERTYPLKHNPRLNAIVNSNSPVRFPIDSDLPDPFDGMVEGNIHALDNVHACLGCPLIVEGETIGVLTADSLTPGAFEHISDDFLRALAALAGATLRTSRVLDALEETARLQGIVAQDLMKQASLRGGELIGTGPLLARLKEELRIVAKSDLAVLIMGETGTGKELVARGIHSASTRFERPLIYVNCAALPESIAESELFGHKKGSFTGAISDRLGKFEVANRGTLFLDEIGELPLSIQAKLLRAIQEGEIQRVGDDKMRKVEVRVIAATNRNLQEEITKGTFRSDLYHRLNVYPLKTPALREHLHDIPLLVGYFCDHYQRRLGCKPFRLTESAVAKLSAYTWPGNVRELKNIISRATLHASQEKSISPRNVVLLESRHLFLPSADSQEEPRQYSIPDGRHVMALQDALTKHKKQIILDAVRRHDGNWAKAATELGLHRSNLYHLRDKLELKYP